MPTCQTQPRTDKVFERDIIPSNNYIQVTASCSTMYSTQQQGTLESELS